MTQALCGHLPVMLARDPKRVAVVGYGSGMTPAAMLCHPGVERLDVLEIEQGVIDASPYFEGINANPLDDPRTRLLVEDGRVHLTYTDAVYDVISSEPSNPWMAGISNLFTTDYYRRVRARLAPGGLFTQWIQAYDISEDLFRAILASVREVFPHVVIFRSNPGDCIVLASGEPIAIPWERFRERFEPPAVRASFLRVGIRNPLEIAYFLHGPEPAMAAYAEGTTARNTDDNVWLEYRMPRALLLTAAIPSSESVAATIAGLGATGRLRGIEAVWPGIPLEDCVREIVAYPHRTEPIVFPDAIFSDPWAETRGILLAGILGELRGRGRADLAERARAWEREADQAREVRVRVTREVFEASIGAANPGGELLARSRAAAPDLPIVNIFIAADLENRGDFAGADAIYRRILDHPPSEMYYDAVLGLARLAWVRGDYEGAIAFCDRAAVRNPFLPGAYTLAVRFHLHKGNTEGARRTIARGLRFDPENAELAASARSLEGTGSAAGG
jgi:hypothetical protein